GPKEGRWDKKEIFAEKVVKDEEQQLLIHQNHKEFFLDV
uniref:Uncharacterized protein n=1 Tax=Panagrolaimus sp. PS1159 TaxID=55785 RepID=A0AC35GJH1_9BILA